MKREEAIKILQPIGEQYCEIANITLAPRMDEIAEAIDMAIDALKAQLSKEGTTSDLISRTETVEHLRRVLGATVPITDYDEGFVDGVEFGVSTASTMPTIQPQSTTGQLNDGARSTDLIDRQQVIDALDCINGVEEVLRSLPPAQPEPHEGYWIWVAGDLECSKCHTRYPDLYPDYDNSVACPHCGARMKGATT